MANFRNVTFAADALGAKSIGKGTQLLISVTGEVLLPPKVVVQIGMKGWRDRVKRITDSPCYVPFRSAMLRYTHDTAKWCASEIVVSLDGLDVELSELSSSLSTSRRGDLERIFQENPMGLAAGESLLKLTLARLEEEKAERARREHERHEEKLRHKELLEVVHFLKDAAWRSSHIDDKMMIQALEGNNPSISEDEIIGVMKNTIKVLEDARKKILTLTGSWGL